MRMRGGKGRRTKTVTRRRWNEGKNGKQGRQRGGDSLAFLFPLSQESQIRFMRRVLTGRKRYGRFVVVQHGGISEGAFAPAFGGESGRGRRRAGLERNKGSRTRERKKVRYACLIWGCVLGRFAESGAELGWDWVAARG